MTMLLTRMLNRLLYLIPKKKTATAQPDIYKSSFIGNLTDDQLLRRALLPNPPPRLSSFVELYCRDSAPETSSFSELSHRVHHRGSTTLPNSIAVTRWSSHWRQPMTSSPPTTPSLCRHSLVISSLP
ncbi:hypothetical protein TorRG33x02_267860 [Trema orientale]|uniref:Uncharacterized protein n=1 Tax=Trema orientale TaxID=63057 RepID=A0A2P5CZH6_TREOI|nr:hypothetical protein TorRG33x02_267860 [Trema orientale]